MKNQNKAAKSAKFKPDIEAMRAKLITGDKFHEIQGFFFDHLGENNNFMKFCKKAKHPMLKSTIHQISNQLFEKEAELTNMMLLKAPKTSFYHGTCFLDGCLTSIIFFEDIKMGMISVVMHQMSETRHIRFTSIKEYSKDHPEEDIPTTVIRSSMIH